jgi:hypothetical protein
MDMATATALWLIAIATAITMCYLGYLGYLGYVLQLLSARLGLARLCATAMLCYALCYAMLCAAMLLLCYAMLLLCYAMLLLCYATAMLGYAPRVRLSGLPRPDSGRPGTRRRGQCARRAAEKSVVVVVGGYTT